MIYLGVNIDHVATLRQARRTYEPDPVWAAAEAHLGGADAITVHLREDRRHIVDRDVELLRQSVQTKLNLEMAATDEMVGIACRLKPEMSTLVPEGRHEVTTEGGLDVAGQEKRLKDVIARMQDAGIYVSLFIDADPRQIEASARVGAQACEIHTGPYAHAFHENGRDIESTAAQAEFDESQSWRDGNPRARHAFQCRPCTQLRQCAADCSPAGHLRTAHRPRHRQPRGLRRPASGGG